MPVDYTRGKIYKIICNTTGLVYIGSTCEPTLAKRLTKHVADYKCWLNGKYHFVTSFKILENANYEILLLELYPCNSKDELHARERYWANQIDCVNKVKNQGIFAELGGKLKYQRKYNEINKEDIKEYQKQYREDNRDSIKEYIKQYHKDNKEIITKYQKQYYETNKEKIDNKMKKKIVCECGTCYTLNNKTHHMKTKQHKRYQENKIYHIIRKGLDLMKKLRIYYKLTKIFQNCFNFFSNYFNIEKNDRK